MKMQEVIEIAKRWGIPYKVGISKEMMIRAIQTKEGNQPCFHTRSVCDEHKCLWMSDCIPGSENVR